MNYKNFAGVISLFALISMILYIIDIPKVDQPAFKSIVMLMCMITSIFYYMSYFTKKSIADLFSGIIWSFNTFVWTIMI